MVTLRAYRREPSEIRSGSERHSLQFGGRKREYEYDGEVCHTRFGCLWPKSKSRPQAKFSMHTGPATSRKFIGALNLNRVIAGKSFALEQKTQPLLELLLPLVSRAL